MDGVTHVVADTGWAATGYAPPKADAAQVSEFEQLMANGARNAPPGVDHYVNGVDSPSRWLSDTVIRAGKEISTSYRDGLETAAIKMETLDPADPMMLPKLASLQMEVHNATFQLQFTTSLVHLANSGIKTLFNLQG